MSDERSLAGSIDFYRVVTTGLIAAAAAIVGSLLTYCSSIRDAEMKYDNLNRVASMQNDTAVRDLDIRIIDISLAILAGEKGGADEKDNPGYTLARDFAIKALSKAADIPVSDADRQTWAAAGTIPFASGAIGLTNDPANVQQNNNADARAGFVYKDNTQRFLSICIGEYFSECPQGTVNHYTCSTKPDEIAMAACPAKFRISTTSSRGGNRCGYATFDIECLS